MIAPAVQLLEALARAGAGVSAADLAARTGIPRASAYRLLNLLVAEELVVRLPDLSGFALGARFGDLVDAAAPVRLSAAVRAELLELRAGMRPAVHLLLVRGGLLRIADADTGADTGGALGVGEPELNRPGAPRPQPLREVLAGADQAQGPGPLPGTSWFVAPVGERPRAALVAV
ncbi:helix-turn-helix domain-containing protein, partial [Kineococcus sp. T13]|uniref:helix-turn-helix domain-containing protein n=1 Tax=Kineococcus vitellinus TaxID=2696565 RepID=UPI0014121620|nr:helix-turn-helix domain-containing protein [Kineococcus vitellinus]